MVEEVVVYPQPGFWGEVHHASSRGLVSRHSYLLLTKPGVMVAGCGIYRYELRRDARAGLPLCSELHIDRLQMVRVCEMFTLLDVLNLIDYV